jgi:hypothetical protein
VLLMTWCARQELNNQELNNLRPADSKFRPAPLIVFRWSAVRAFAPGRTTLGVDLLEFLLTGYPPRQRSPTQEEGYPGGSARVIVMGRHPDRQTVITVTLSVRRR